MVKEASDKPTPPARKKQGHAFWHEQCANACATVVPTLKKVLEKARGQEDPKPLLERTGAASDTALATLEKVKAKVTGQEIAVPDSDNATATRLCREAAAAVVAESTEEAACDLSTVQAEIDVLAGKYAQVLALSEALIGPLEQAMQKEAAAKKPPTRRPSDTQPLDVPTQPKAAPASQVTVIPDEPEPDPPPAKPANSGRTFAQRAGGIFLLRKPWG